MNPSGDSNPSGDNTAAAVNKEQLLARLHSVATSAEAVALRSSGGVGKLALLGALAAGWLAFFFSAQFSLSLTTTLIIFLLCAVPAAALAKMYGMLREVIGLPGRVALLSQQIGQQVGSKLTALRDQYVNKTAAPAARSRFAELRQALQTLSELKAYRDELGEAFTLMTGAIAIGNPVFALLLMLASIAVVLLTIIAAITLLIFLF